MVVSILDIIAGVEQKKHQDKEMCLNLVTQLYDLELVS